jgi:predicted acetyltransferase
MTDPLRLVVPAPIHLPSYRDALERGWSPDDVNGWAAALRELDWIDRAPQDFLFALDDPQARGAPLTLPDGTTRPRLPSVRRWLWDGEFCGSIGLRWQPGTERLPAHVLGHIGFAIVPWKRGHGLAAWALTALLPYARTQGLRHIEITTDPDNIAAQKTIERCGGLLVEQSSGRGRIGDMVILNYRIDL